MPQPPERRYDGDVVARPRVEYPAAVLIDRIYTTRHALEIVEDGGRRYARRYVSYSASIRDGRVEFVDRADDPLDVTPLPLSRGEAANYIVTKLPDLQTSACFTTLERLIA